MRKFAWMNLFLALIMLLSACATSVPATPAPEATVAEKAAATAVPAPTATPVPAAAEEEPVAVVDPESKYNESPMLAERVRAGELPPVDERLPANPMVVEPLVEQGQYGGELKYGFVGTSAAWGGLLYLAGWDHPVIWTPDYNGVEPNAIERWEANAEATEYTWYLRKGMKWSDGADFSADDIMFYLDDVIGNLELFPGGRGADWLPGDMREGFEAKKVDDYTVKLIFPQPYGTFMIQLATWGGRQFTQYPAHYLKQFHADYNPDVATLVAQDSMAEDWISLFFRNSADTWGDPQRFFEIVELPSVGPWIVKQPLGTGTTLILERNPYYWKVDSEGNQLPYIDRVVATSYQDDQSRTFAMLNGDLDFVKDPGEPNRELYFEAMDQGKPIEILKANSDGGNTQSIHFNLTTKDPVKNEVFNNIDFRIGMSYAIDRDEIIEVVFKGQGEPSQVCPLVGSPIYHEQLCNQYLAYDLDLANEHLDKVLPEKDAQGFRLGPDGKRFVPVFTVHNDLSYGTHYVQVTELLVAYWKAVGVEVQIDAVTDAVWGESRFETNDIEMFLFHGGEGGAGITAILDPRWHVPGEHWGIFSRGWRLWWTDTTDENEYKVEPPEYAQEVRDLYMFAIQQPTAEGQIAAMNKILDKSAEYFWTIGVSRPGQGYQPIHVRLGNVPDGHWGGWLPGVHKIIRPEQWYIKQ
jgi:peptide/nickel transport system substrate-binding protein